MKQIFILYIIAILSISCHRQARWVETDTSTLEEIIVDPQNGNILSLDSLIERVEFVKLETNDKDLIGKISQIYFSDSLIFVVDSRFTKSIFIYNMQGQLHNKISQIGNGPGEYSELSNVNFLPEKQLLIVFDRPQKRILSYSYNGEWISTETPPFLSNYFEYSNSGFKAYECYGLDDVKLGKDKNNTLIVTNADNKVLYSFHKDIYNTNFTYTKNKTLRIFDNEIYYSPNINDTIYLITDSLVKAQYCIQIPNHNIPNRQEYLTNSKFEDFLNNHFFFNGDFIELKDFTYVNIMTPWGYPSIIYSHSKKISYLTSNQGNNPFYAFLNTAPKARYQDNCIVLDVDAYIILSVKEKLYQNKTEMAKLNFLFENLTEDSNPVLFFYHLNSNL